MMSKKMSRRTGQYPFLKELCAEWKPRAKKAKILLKDLAVEAGMAPQHLTKIISNECKNPRLKTINDFEMALREAEKRAGLR